MKRRFIIVFIELCLVSLFAISCRTAELTYISDAERDSAQVMLNTYNAEVRPGDELYIYVYSQTPESAIPFNQESRAMVLDVDRVNRLSNIKSTAYVLGTYTEYVGKTVGSYEVRDDGSIDFPFLGELSVANISKDSLERYIENRLIADGYLKDPIVTVSSLNSRVSVVGEVAKPKELHIDGDRLTIFEALAMCGDLTLYGRRDNVVVVREKKGTVTLIEVDLTSRTMFDSEAYYLQNNDIVYVQPNKQRARMLRINEDWPNYLSTSAQVLWWVYRLTRSYVRASSVID